MSQADDVGSSRAQRSASSLLHTPSRIALVGALAASLALAACDTSAIAQTAGAAPALPEVTVAAPLIESVNVYEDVVGRFAAVQSIEIRPQVSGRLSAVHFEDGQQVRAGDPLFTIDPAPFQAAADRARAELARTEAQREVARAEFRRAESLVGRDAISEEEFDRRRRGVEEADAAVHASEAALRAAEIDVGYTTITAPIDGRVSDRRVDPGNLVGAGDSLLTTLVTQSPIHAEFAVAPALAAVLPRPGAEPADAGIVTIKLEGESEFAHEGRIDFIDNQVDPRTGVVRVRAVLDNPDGRFAAGQFVRVRFTRSRIDDAVLVPDTAVSSDQNLKLVMVVNAQDVIEPRPIVAGPVVDGLRIVQSGLEGEERVIIGGGQRAYPGMQVTATPGRIELASR
jgi:RND family efflux transporter MFP subunit